MLLKVIHIHYLKFSVFHEDNNRQLSLIFSDV